MQKRLQCAMHRVNELIHTKQMHGAEWWTMNIILTLDEKYEFQRPINDL